METRCASSPAGARRATTDPTRSQGDSMNVTTTPQTEPAHAPVARADGLGVTDLARRARLRLLQWTARGPALPILVMAAAFLAVSPALWNGFVEWDDYVNLFENRSFRGLGWKQLRWMFTSTLMGHYIPVTWLTFGLDYTI